MPTYLLTCECGKSVPVEMRQAGERVACECGATLEVPTLRKLRHFPVSAPALEESTAAWSPRRGIVAACLILAAVLTAVAAWNWYTEPVVEPFNLAGRQQAVEEGLEQMTPAEAWRSWIEGYRPLADTGFRVFENPHTAEIEQEISRRRFLQKTLLVTAGVLAAVAIVAALWPAAAETRRQGDKETRRVR